MAGSAQRALDHGLGQVVVKPAATSSESQDVLLNDDKSATERSHQDGHLNIAEVAAAFLTAASQKTCIINQCGHFETSSSLTERSVLE